MVNTFANVYANVNQAYMAGLMAAPMVIIELALMGAMYGDRSKNLIITAVSLATLVMFWILIRQQTAITGSAVLTIDDSASPTRNTDGPGNADPRSRD